MAAKIFNGKRYELSSTLWSKSAASKYAKKVREDGYNARVVKSSDKFAATGDGYAVYVRKRKR